MEFETRLSQEQIQKKLLVTTKPYRYINGFTEGQMLSKWNKNNTFYLWKIGDMPVRQGFTFFPFVGRVQQRNSGTRIVGKFAPTKSWKITAVSFFGTMWARSLPMYFRGFQSGLFDLPQVLLQTGEFIIWAVLICAVIFYVSGIFQKRQRAATMEFIEKQLRNEYDPE